MHSIPKIYQTVRATVWLVRLSTLLRRVALGCAAAICCAAVWQVWRA